MGGSLVKLSARWGRLKLSLLLCFISNNSAEYRHPEKKGTFLQLSAVLPIKKIKYIMRVKHCHLLLTKKFASNFGNIFHLKANDYSPANQ